MEVVQSSKAKEKVQALNVAAADSDDDFLSGSDDSLFDIECDICALSFSSVKTYEQHLKGKRHHKVAAQIRLMAKVSKLNNLKARPPKADGNSDDEDDDSKEMYCDICDKSVSGYIPYLAHMKGSVHTKNLKKRKMKDEMKDMPDVLDKENVKNGEEDDDIIEKPYARCDSCKKVFSGPENFRQHMKSGGHKKQLKMLTLIENLKSKQPNELQNGGDEDEMSYTCNVCDKCFSGPVPYHIHLESTVHKKELKKAEVVKEIKEFCVDDTSDPNYTCKECKKPFSSPFAFKLHLVRNDHQKEAARTEIITFLTSHPEIAMITQDEDSSSEGGKDTNGDYDKDSYFLICKLCHVSFSGPESAQTHVKSKKHLATIKEKRKLKHLKQRKAAEKTSAIPAVQNDVPDDNVDKQNIEKNLPRNDSISPVKSALNSNEADAELHLNEDFELI